MYSKLLIGILAAQSLLTLNASVAPCITGSLESYEALANAGCSIGPLMFRNFDFSVISSSGGAVPITASDLILTPADMPPTLFGFTFAPSSPGELSVIFPQAIEYSLTYDVDYPPIIVGGQGDLHDPSMLPGFSSVSETLTPMQQATALPLFPQGCGGPHYKLPPPITIQIASNGVLTDSARFANLVCTYTDTTTITLNASAGVSATADILSFAQKTINTPEPSYGLPIGLGACLLLISRRVASRL
jgi:hypothetical protein